MCNLDEERVSQFQCGFYIRTASLLFCTDITREEVGCANLDGQMIPGSVEFMMKIFPLLFVTNVTRGRS